MILGPINLEDIVKNQKKNFWNYDLDDRSYDFVELEKENALFQGQMTKRTYLTEKEEGLCRICYDDG